MKLEGKERKVYEAACKDFNYKDEQEFLEFAEQDGMYVEVLYDEYEKLVAIADGCEYDSVFEINELRVGRFTVGYDPYEDYEAEDL